MTSDKCLPVYTTKAPLEVVSFLYRLGCEASEQKQSSKSLRSVFDCSLPEPLLRVWSSRMAEVVPVTPSSSVREVKDWNTVYSSSNFEDEEKLLVVPSGMSEETSDVFLFEQCYSADIEMHSSEDSQYEDFNIDFAIKSCRKRAKSTDYAYSEANEASRAVVASLKTTAGLQTFLRNEKPEQNLLLRFAKDQLSEGRHNRIASKPMLNTREKRYQEEKDNLVRICQKRNSPLYNPSARPKGYKSSLEDFTVDQFVLSALSGYI